MKPYLQALSAFVLGFIAIATIAAVQSTARFPSIELRDFLTIIGGPSTTNHIGGAATALSGNFAVKTNHFVVNTNTGFVGIGTNTPEANLHVIGTNALFVLNPNAGVNDNTLLMGVWSPDDIAIGAWNSWPTPTATVPLIFSATNVLFRSYASGAYTDRMLLSSAGNLGIGTVNPLAKLSVIGGANIGSTTDPGANNLNVVGTTTVGTSVSTPTLTSDSNLNIAPAVGSNTVFTFTNPGTFTVNTNWLAITNGHVGIGRVGPIGAVSGEQLTIQGSGNTGFLVASTGTGTPRIYFRSVPGGTPSSEMGTASHHRLDFTMNTTPRMSIAPTTGNVGVNTTTPLARLAINGGVHVGGDSDPGDDNLLVDGTTTTATLEVSGTGYVNDLYATNDVSALTFTDRSDSPNTIEEAYRIVLSHTPKDGRVDHAELDPLAWGRDQSRRNMSMVMSAQSMVIQDLMKRLAKLENNENN